MSEDDSENQSYIDLEAKILRQEHRLFSLITNFWFRKKNYPDPNDPRRPAVVKALVWQSLFSSEVVAVGGGLIAVITLALFYWQNSLIQESNQLLAQSISPKSKFSAIIDPESSGALEVLVSANSRGPLYIMSAMVHFPTKSYGTALQINNENRIVEPNKMLEFFFGFQSGNRLDEEDVGLEPPDNELDAGTLLVIALDTDGNFWAINFQIGGLFDRKKNTLLSLESGADSRIFGYFQQVSEEEINSSGFELAD